MTERGRLLAVAALGALLGGAIGSGAVVMAQARTDRPPPRGRTEPSEERAADTPPAAGFDVGLLRADLRAIVRDEVAAALARQPCAPTPAREPAPPPAPAAVAGPEAMEAEREAQRLVDRALSRGAWTDDDAQAMRRLLGALTNEQRDDLMRQLVPAMNDGRVKRQFTGPPF